MACLQCGHAVPVRALIQAGSAFAQLLGCLGVFCLYAISLRGNKRKGVLCKSGAHRLGQFEVARSLSKNRFGELKIEGARFSRQHQVFFYCSALICQFIGHALHNEVAG